MITGDINEINTAAYYDAFATGRVGDNGGSISGASSGVLLFFW